MFSRGVIRFLYGFNKKMLLANLFAVVADKAFGMEAPGCGMAWLGALCYTLQIFFDFSGYSDMAIGLGLVFGFRFLENFDYPYVSKTVPGKDAVRARAAAVWQDDGVPRADERDQRGIRPGRGVLLA